MTAPASPRQLISDKCRIADLDWNEEHVYSGVLHVWPHADGRLELQLPDLPSPDVFETYVYCNGCGERFFNWEEARRHLNGKEVA